jgi:glycerate-2-kinase
MCENILLADNEYALQVAYNIAKSLGYSARISKKKLEGEPHRMAKKILDGMGNFRGIMIWGGETNVKVNGDGIGGRNQELALYLAKGIGDMKSGFLCMGTDGVDGPTDAAGGMVDGETIKRVWEKGIDLAHELKRHNSYEVLKKLGDLIITGYTGTNLADICLGVLQ